MSKESGALLYKCRLCGEVSAKAHTPGLIMSLACVTAGAPEPEGWGPLTTALLSVHSCKDGRMGIADLVGGEFDQ